MAHLENGPKPVDTILLAEDNPDHVILIKRSFMHARFLNPVQVTSDGVETIAYLNGDGQFSDRTKYPFPALLLLDLKMPNKDGFEVMEWIQEQRDLPPLRIVVLTTSDRIFDVRRAYSLGAVGFLTKPLNLHQFIQLGPAIKGFWLWNSGEAGAEERASLPAKQCGPNDINGVAIPTVVDVPPPPAPAAPVGQEALA